MFTGIIEEIGIIRAVRRGVHSSVLSIEAENVLSDLKIGDSVAVNGVCLTAVSVSASGFSADVMHETLDRSTLGALAPGSRVNLERAMSANGRFGGHIVSGHIDGPGVILKTRRDDNAVWYTVETAPAQMHYIVEKGSIAIDGISLTVAEAGETWFSVSVIPHTAASTTLGGKKSGDPVNLETDLLGKYVEKLLCSRPAPIESHLTMEFLAQHGF